MISEEFTWKFAFTGRMERGILFQIIPFWTILVEFAVVNIHSHLTRQNRVSWPHLAAKKSNKFVLCGKLCTQKRRKKKNWGCGTRVEMLGMTIELWALSILPPVCFIKIILAILGHTRYICIFLQENQPLPDFDCQHYWFFVNSFKGCIYFLKAKLVKLIFLYIF